MASKQDHYAVLGVGPSATLQDVKSAYRKKALKCHPDAGGTEAEFTALSHAYEVLSDKASRADYDRRTQRSGIRNSPGVQRGFARRSPQTSAYNFDAWNQAHYGAEEALKRKQEQWRRANPNINTVHKRSMPWMVFQVVVTAVVSSAVCHQMYGISRTR